jgi:parallel beta-helix repeat protein
VERDGSGDFATIRPAIAASAPGDTILLGPGRYDEVEPLVTPGWTEPTYVPVSVDSLTIRGVDRDSVIIGPPEADFVGFGPKGFVTLFDLTRAVIENLTVENVREGFYLVAKSDLRNCVVRNCDLGAIVLSVGSLIAECSFNNNVGDGIVTATGCGDLTIEDCGFIDNNLGVGVNVTQNVTIQRCSFENSEWTTGGIQYSDSSTGSVSDCVFDGSQEGIAVRSSSEVTLTRNRFSGHEVALHVFDGSIARGTKNVFRGSGAALFFSTTSTAYLNDNHIVKSDGWAVLCSGFNLHHVDIDLRSNYWGTDSPDSIDAWIYDENDEPDPPFNPGMVTVLYEPFSPVPVDAEKESLGSLKGLFRRR